LEKWEQGRAKQKPQNGGSGRGATPMLWQGLISLQVGNLAARIEWGDQ